MRSFLLFLMIALSINVIAQRQKPIDARRRLLEIIREDGNVIPINVCVTTEKSKPVIYIINQPESIRVDKVRYSADSIFITMPVFESTFKGKMDDAEWKGTWTKGTAGNDQLMPFKIVIGEKRFEAVNGNAKVNVSGRWAINFESDKSKKPLALAEFKQNGNNVTGTFLTPSGDYRYQQGIVTGNKLFLSGFDGAHAYMFRATVEGNKLVNGEFISGKTYKENWTGIKDPKAKVSTDGVAMFARPGETKLDFHFNDINGNDVSINDARFKNKVVIIQLMGSWCPNCMDETAFLKDFYRSYKSKGVEIVALAYEYSTDLNRSIASLNKFKERFSIEYPILISGVSVRDTLRTEKTLPQLTPIKVFPSTIILDRKGNISKIETDFFGPGTGKYYEEYKKNFYKTIDELL